ncbi:tRNA pseudouridine(55) synthase TruB [Methylomicrobium lacus]|uniref:tRNA pseudouridine(55) synthase TruB n=1 Tax=Methylomicrobium lacus TaxID=136992 RepID=UPI0035A880AC
MSKRANRRNVHGILLLDKRLGVSSNQALQEVKRLLNAAKAGHTGSLDPLATGLLPLCFGEATKVSAMMLDDDKRYRVVIRLGVLTDTGDAEGAVLETKPVPEISQAMLDDCLKRFTGELDQVPPMYSALKLNGRKLYELAREGKTVERKARRITIYALRQLDFEGDRLTLEVFCSKGTYIRSLAEDIGTHFGCGATVAELRRLQAGMFDLGQAVTIEQLRAMDADQLDACLLNVDMPLQALPAVELQDVDAGRIRNGQAVNAESSGAGQVRLYHAGAFLGLGEMRMDGKLAPCRLFNLAE